MRHAVFNLFLAGAYHGKAGVTISHDIHLLKIGGWEYKVLDLTGDLPARAPSLEAAARGAEGDVGYSSAARLYIFLVNNKSALDGRMRDVVLKRYQRSKQLGRLPKLH